jgi:acetoin utilization deacetylase AcuC-like enzyme
MTAGLVYDPIYLEHDTGDHVENSGRLRAIMELLEQSGLLQRLTRIAPRQATVEELCLVHTERHVELVERASSGNGHWLDGDTFASPDSYRVALYAAGGVLSAVDAIMAGEIEHAFALVRPPGHHATANRAMGFCLFNNVAIGARYAARQHNLSRILIADFDVHHGNGTEALFYDDPGVMYFSTHQYPHYPGTGARRDDGAGAGKGLTLNVPLPAGTTDTEYKQAYEEVLLPAARRFKPEFILVSAGYDPHWADYLSGFQITVSGFAGVVSLIKQLADELCQGRLLLSLEGGYHLKALSHSVRATFEVLLGMPPGPDPLGDPRF